MGTLQDRARSLRNKLELLGITEDAYLVVKDTYAVGTARSFYKEWAQFNQECISAGYDRVTGEFSFVAKQLDRVLLNFPADKTKIDISDVFQSTFPGAGFIFNCYLLALEDVEKAQQS